MNDRIFDWKVVKYFSLYHAFVFISLPLYFIYAKPVSGLLIGLSLIFFFLGGLSVTAGYHRCFSHRAFKAHPVVEWLTLFFGAMTVENSVLCWAHDHRLHHAHVDTDKDPYSINKGFWYAHFLWILCKTNTRDFQVVNDLKRNPRVAFQHKHYLLLSMLSNAFVWTTVGLLTNDFVGAFFIAVLLRVFTTHHLTWFINSLAHTWGDRPFCQEQTAVNNFIISVLTFGEGYHNYHHVFAKDYRNGVRWYHFDPTKWTIWFLEKIGLASDLHRIDKLSIKSKMVAERKVLLLNRLKEIQSDKKEDWERTVQDLSQRISEKMIACRTLYESLKNEKHTGQESAVVSEIKQKIAQYRSSLKQDKKEWRHLSKAILQ